MGLVEEVFVLRDDYPIAHIEYKGHIMIVNLEKLNIEGSNKEMLDCKINGDDFNKILKNLQEELSDELTEYFIWYFEDLSIRSTDVIIVKWA